MKFDNQDRTIVRVPPLILHNGIEFISTEEAARWLGVSLTTISNRVKAKALTPLRIPGVTNIYGRPAHYFRADQVRRLMP